MEGFSANGRMTWHSLVKATMPDPISTPHVVRIQGALLQFKITAAMAEESTFKEARFESRVVIQTTNSMFRIKYVPDRWYQEYLLTAASATKDMQMSFVMPMFKKVTPENVKAVK